MINFISGIQSTASALAAERVRMDVISQNIANANTTHGANGLPYQRQQVVFETVLNQQQRAAGLTDGPQTLRVAKILSDNRPPRMVYNPGHPDADAQGMVAVPDISIHEEMADLITSSRAFEANLAVVKNSRQMALQSLSIAKH